MNQGDTVLKYDGINGEIFAFFCNLCNVFYLIKSRCFFRYSNILSFGRKKAENYYYVNKNSTIYYNIIDEYSNA